MNPERPWPTLEAFAATTAERGYDAPRATDDLPAGTRRRPDPYLAGEDARPRRGAARAPTAWPSRARRPSRSRWQDPDVRWKPRTIDLHVREGRRSAGLREPTPSRSTGTSTRSRTRSPATWDDSRQSQPRAPRARRSRRRSRRPSGTARSPTRRPWRCSRPRAPRSTRCARRRRPPRGGGRRRGHLRDQPEHQLHQRLLRGVPLLRVRPAGGGRRVLHAHARARWPTGPRRRGRTGRREVCMQGGIHPDLPGDFYFDLLDAVTAPRPGHPHPRVQPDGGPERRDEARHLVPGVPH